MPAKDIGIDLGTRNSLVFSTGRGIVLREPSVVIYDKDTEKIRAIGEEARQMASHLTSNMEVIWPIRGGVIVDYNVMEKMLKYFISQAMGRRAFRKPRVSISVPSGITEIERKAMEEAAYQSGARCGSRYYQAVWKSDRGYRCGNYRCGCDICRRSSCFCFGESCR